MKVRKNKSDYRNEIVRSINITKRLYEGEVFGIMGSKMGFLNCAELDSVFTISPDQMEFLFPSDRVNFSISNQDKKGARIEGLVSSTFKRFTGELYEDGTGAYIIPDVYGLNRKIRVPQELIKYGESSGDFVSAEIIEHPLLRDGKPEPASASILGVISKFDSNTRESSYCVYKNDLPTRFSSEILSEFSDVSERVISEKSMGRVDLRRMPFISIDGPSAFDIDDAIYVEKHSDRYKLYVSISDVSEFIPSGTSINKEISDRCSSVYLLGNYIPMLPSDLSRICSLDARGDVLAMTVEMDVDFSGKLMSYEIYESIISDNLKLSYDFVEDVVSGFSEPSIDGLLRFNGSVVYSKYMNSIFNLYNLHKDLLSNRDNIFGDIDDGGFRVELDSRTKRIQNISKVEDKTSKSMVRECMLLTNSVVAKFIYENIGESRNSLFVVRDGVKPSRLNELKKILDGRIDGFCMSELDSIDGFNRMLSHFDKESKEVILTYVKDSLYSNDHRGNFYRGLNQYTHFTSPLRRYPDILVHRIVKAILRGETKSFELGVNVDKLNAKIRNIKRTEREVDSWLRYHYLCEHYNKTTMDARVISVSENIIKVRLVENGIEGIVVANKGFKDVFKAHFDRGNFVMRSERLGDIKALDILKVVRRDFDFINKQIIFRIQR